jgi:hypothetical protein
MIRLNWSGKPANGWSCERDHLCAWIVRLPIERHFAWTVDELDEDDPEQAVILASGVGTDLAAAQQAVVGAMIALGARPHRTWRARENGVVIDLFPRSGRPAGKRIASRARCARR